MIREKDIQVHLPKSLVEANQNLCGRRGADETEKKYGFGYHSRKVKIIFFPNKGRKKKKNWNTAEISSGSKLQSGKEGEDYSPDLKQQY